MEDPIQYKIKCSIFSETYLVIKKILLKFKRANSEERRYYVGDILTEVQSLFSCGKFTHDNTDCINCHTFANSQIQKFASFRVEELI